MCIRDSLENDLDGITTVGKVSLAVYEALR